MKFFGPTQWGNPAIERTEVPVGKPCLYCEIPIFETDYGAMMPYVREHDTVEIAYHRKCLLASIFGTETAERMVRDYPLPPAKPKGE